MKKNGFTLWFTGLPCSGKTTIADELAKKLKEEGLKIERLDGDIVRQELTKDLGFSKEDRQKNLERVTFVAKLLSRNSVGVLATFVSPYQEVRDYVRKNTTNFMEVFVKCPVEECIKRDVKGMYKKALAGEIKNFTGIDDPYEDPTSAEITVDTFKENLETCVNSILNELNTRGFLQENLFAPNEKYETKDEEKIKERLKNLGYI